jgi:hypothetical protein
MLRCLVDVDADRVALIVNVDHDAVADLPGVGGRSCCGVYVEETP